MKMEKFWELFEQSFIITGTVTVLVIIGAVVMVARQTPIPDWYQAVVLMVLSFFFGAKSGVMTGKRAA